MKEKKKNLTYSTMNHRKEGFVINHFRYGSTVNIRYGKSITPFLITMRSMT